MHHSQYTKIETRMVNTIEAIQDYFSYFVGVKFSFTIGKGADANVQKIQGKITVFFGQEKIISTFRKGFREYDEVVHVWTGQGPLVGDKGVWALVLHEVTHILQFAEGKEGDPHGPWFQQQLAELIREFPFEG